jgi:hypothetical protein
MLSLSDLDKPFRPARRRCGMPAAARRFQLSSTINS